MRKLFVFVATVVAGLALAGVAQAGCMATVGLSSMPMPARPGFGIELSPTVAMHPACATPASASPATTVATKTKSFLMRPPSDL